MRNIMLAALTGFVLGGSALLPPQAFAGPNCTCRHSGGDVEEGQTACIKGPKGMTMARCERVLNNTSWKMLDAPCPLSGGFELGPPNSLPGDWPGGGLPQQADASPLSAPLAVLTAQLGDQALSHQ
ncbi:MAG: hypothetical protein KDJ80_03110 [Nitratireductor sp.]|nr:hypothetical protein [Nitratireductor sp.]